jgi:radical SAM-linked protein
MPGRQPEPRDVAPTVQRLRVHYTKRGRLRFTSHRDFQRVFERAVRRAELPVAFSAGFSPHPKISYVGAAATGAASEAEYLEIGLSRRLDPAAVRAALDGALPAGFDVVEVVDAPAGTTGAMADRIDASHWLIQLGGVRPDDAAAAVAAFLAADAVPVERVLKDGRRTLDARAPVVRLEVLPAAAGDAAARLPGVVQPAAPDPCAILDLVVRHVTPAVRPDDVVAGLRRVSSFVPPMSPLVTRLAQGHLDETGRLADPLAPDRVAAAGPHSEPAV